MAHVDGKGRVYLGLASSPGTVDGRVIATPGGGICPLTDDRAIFQTQINGAWTLAAADVNTGVVEPLPSPGANELVAGGGRWLAGLGGVGMYGSLGHMPLAWPKAAGADGTLAYVRDYQLGLGLVLNAPNGSETDIPHAVAVDAQVLGPTSVLWHDGRTLSSYGCEPLRPALPAGRTRVVVLNGVTWLVYWRLDDKGLIAQVNGADEGYVLETRPICFNHDAGAVNGQIVIGYSRTGGEGLGDDVKVIIDPSRPRTKLTADIPVDVVVPHPVDPVKPTDPEPHSMRLPDQVQRIVNELYAKHRNLAEGDDDQRRSLAGMIAEQARYAMGPDWGWKRAGEGRPPSKDAIAFKGGPELIGWDLFNGSTRAPADHPESISLAGQVFIDVAPINHLGDVTAPPPPTDPVDPPPSGDVSALILAELRKLSAHLGVR